MGCGASSKAKYSVTDDKVAQVARSDTVNSASTVTAGRRSLATWEDDGFVKSWNKPREDLISTGIIKEDYDTEKWSHRIGKGASGSVYRATHRASAKQVAVKKCYKVRPDDVLAFKREAVLMGNIDHPNVIKIFEVFEDKRCVYFVFELCAGGELLRRISQSESFTENICAHVMIEVLHGVSYLHGRQICHRDLKPENFLLLEEKEPLIDSTLKIIDFGSATFIETGEILNTVTGTPAYMAPEVFSGSYHLVCDIWSCGVVAHFLLSGTLPFQADATEELYSQVKNGDYSLEGPHWQHASDGAKDFVSKCMTPDPGKRWRGRQALRHEWLKNDSKQMCTMPILDNLAKYYNANKEKSESMDTMSQLLSAESCTQLTESFKHKDIQGDGFLKIADVITILQQSGLNLPLEHIMQLVRSWDKDRSGTIDYNEFTAGLNQSHSQAEEEICMAAFRQIDKDANGVLTRDELIEAQTELLQIMQKEEAAQVLGPQIIERVMEMGDLDGDGQISFDEFMLLVTGRQADSYAQWSMNVVSRPSMISTGVYSQGPIDPHFQSESTGTDSVHSN